MKRLIFALLFQDGSYLLSRNFRLQKVGDIRWVLKNYSIREVSQGIDELMILDLSQTDTKRDQLREEVRILAEECFVPLTVGGRIRSLEEVGLLLSLGADKVLLNTPFFSEPKLCRQIAETFGSQVLVAGVDVSRKRDTTLRSRQGCLLEPAGLSDHIRRAVDCGAGEIMIQSVDRDGTGNGLDLELAEDAGELPLPLILIGGVGHSEHIVEGLLAPRVDAVATANLFNFVGDALVRTRARCLERGVLMADWRGEDLGDLKGVLQKRSTDSPA
jgi:cyclase